MAEARQKVANLTRALITAGKLPDGGKQLRERIAQAEREVRRLEEEVRKRPGGAGPSGVSLVNQEWEAKRRELTGMTNHHRTLLIMSTIREPRIQWSTSSLSPLIHLEHNKLVH